MTLQPRLLADFAAVPTKRERAATRAHWRNASPSLFDTAPEHEHEHACPVCAGPHDEHACPHGTAPTLPTTGDTMTRNPYANRLTDADRVRIAHRISTLGAATRRMIDSERRTTIERAAAHEIGCATYDLRESELLEIAGMVVDWCDADRAAHPKEYAR